MFKISKFYSIEIIKFKLLFIIKPNNYLVFKATRFWYI